ncbi:hypothetical protein FA743_13410 [Paracoccus gahaiensis]|uniref:Uncharacterized protein n=1 Tax=Paracoccus gahaiensis TaxID=1706839 RepID=A0A4U0R772_9RHOB|nr:hypothetical protein [Paracoccus gahaiensis]TJZ90901.1 hypothetical protein FA743_13410 [Paracoccus gahaiensis]
MTRPTPSEPRDPAGSTPLPGQSDAASAAGDTRTDASAGEGGATSDMSFTRIQPKTGAMMMLGTIGLPLAIILLLVIVVLIAF